MKTKINITHSNRERQNIWFQKEDDNLYTIHTTSSYALEYSSINFTSVPNDAEIYDICFNDGTKGLIVSFDPAGGPYIQVGGYEIEGKKVSRIYNKDNKTYFSTL